ncbi:MAG: PhzF family phenazine biosynthesis protein [Neisseria sp.]|nr:PhzF family phenazine biosynthesis protein [Neisseria sp.]
MREYAFKLVNVFAEQHFGGNPLAVFAEADGLSDEAMQQIARQFNLSETVFAFQGTGGAAADLRIFTPEYELPLAGHPTLGSAYVLQRQRGLGADFVLNTRAKAVRLHGEGNKMTMRISGYTCRAATAGRENLADALSLPAEAVAEQAFWVNSGSPQLLLQVRDTVALQQARADVGKLTAICQTDGGRVMVYLWCEQGDAVHARMLFEQNGAILEDSGTGSAAANLGAYYATRGLAPIARTIAQGDAMQRPNRLYLRVDAEENIFVGGRVVEVGEGMFRLP